MPLPRRLRQTFALALSGAAFSFALSGAAFAQQCPDWQLGGIPLNTDSETAWVAQQYPLFAGGGLDLSISDPDPARAAILAASLRRRLPAARITDGVGPVALRLQWHRG